MKQSTARLGALWERARRPAGRVKVRVQGLGASAQAFWPRIRRPATMFAIGVGLAGPASAFMARENTAGAARAARGASADEAGFMSAERADAEMTLGLSRLYDVPVGLAAEIHHAASTEGIPSRLAFGLVKTESEFKRTAVSPVGAVGFTQVMPATAKDLKPGTTRKDLFDGRTNLQLGFKYLKQLIKYYDGDVRLALTAYNRGPGTVDRLVKRGRNPENGYATRVLSDPASQQLKLAQADASPRVEKAKAPAKKAHHARRHTTKHHAVKKATTRKHAVKKHTTRKHAVHTTRKKRHLR